MSGRGFKNVFRPERTPVDSFPASRPGRNEIMGGFPGHCPWLMSGFALRPFNNKPQRPLRFRFNSFISFASGSVLMTSSFVSQPLRAKPAPSRR